MNADRFFLDTNVLLYSFDPTVPAKQTAAQLWIARLWDSGAGRISWQVLHEFYVNALRKLAVPSPAARRNVERLSSWKPVDSSLGLIQRAWYWTDEARIPYWDSLIVAAAERLDCEVLLSEDFQTGRRFGSVTVVNPFEAHPNEFGLKPIDRQHWSN